MKINIELEEKDIAKLLDLLEDYVEKNLLTKEGIAKFGKFLESLADKIDKKADGIKEELKTKSTIDLAKQAVETIACNSISKMQEALGSLNNIIASTGNATILDYMEYIAKDDPDFEDLCNNARSRFTFSLFGWTKLIDASDIGYDAETDKYFLKGDNIVYFAKKE